MVSLTTTDRARGLKFCLQLAAHMEQMLDDDLHISLPPADVTAFFNAELKLCLDRLQQRRRIERMDGTLTADKMRRNRMSSHVLQGMVKHGISDVPCSDVMKDLIAEDRAVALDVHETFYRKIVSPEFEDQILERAACHGSASKPSKGERLHIRWAALEAYAAAYSALDDVPLNYGPKAHSTAVTLLRELAASPVASELDGEALRVPSAVPLVEPDTKDPARIKTRPAPDVSQVSQPDHTKVERRDRALTPGVSLIEGRITGSTIKLQKADAENQPEAAMYDGLAANASIDVVTGEDILGTAVRMNRISQAKAETGRQKLKTISLFILITGIQCVTDVRQHHLDLFSRTLVNDMPSSYWKSENDQDMTCQELINVARRTEGAKIGFAAATVERHLVTIKNVLEHADREGNTCGFKPRIRDLIPQDDRTDSEKRGVFTFDQISHLFNHPRWQGFKSVGRPHDPGTLVSQDHHYWVNLLLAYTGARRSEIAGLLAGDVGDEEGIPFIHIRANYLRGLKTKSSRRRIPLHPHLLKLGFVEFAKKIDRTDAPLFPAAIPANVRADVMDPERPMPEYQDKFGDVLDHVIRSCIERRFPGNPDKLMLHSMRHYVNETLIGLRDEDGIGMLIPEMDRRDILGHDPGDVNLKAYRRHERPLAPLHAAISRLPRLF